MARRLISQGDNARFKWSVYGVDTPAAKQEVVAKQNWQQFGAPSLLTMVGSERSGGDYQILYLELNSNEGVLFAQTTPEHLVLHLTSGNLKLEAGGVHHNVKAVEVGNFVSAANPMIYNPGNTKAAAVITAIPGNCSGDNVLSRFLVNSIGMPIVKVEAGTFKMGSANAPRSTGNPLLDLFQAGVDECPLRDVTISSPFGIGMFPVTIGEFKKFVDETNFKTAAENGSGSVGIDLATGLVERSVIYNWRSPWQLDGKDIGLNDAHPVVGISYEDALEFCRWLSQKESKKYRLPTEAEWEYACRAGSQDNYSFGNDPAQLSDYANIADASLREIWIQKVRSPDPAMPPLGMRLPPYAKNWNDKWPFTSPRGAFRANQWGICDMHGNVGEWCSDWYDPNYYKDSSAVDPKGPAEEVAPEIDVSFIPGLPAELKRRRKLRVIRGGVWLDPVIGCRSADRRTHVRHPIDAAADVGFRVVVENETAQLPAPQPAAGQPKTK